jgi:hypothetical protein
MKTSPRKGTSWQSMMMNMYGSIIFGKIDEKWEELRIN